MDTRDGDADIQTKKILFMTNAESGQANTILAMAAEAAARPHVEVHVASFPILKQRVERLSPQLNFHPLDGKSIGEVLVPKGLTEERLPHPPTTKSSKPYRRDFPLILAVWDGESYMRIYESIRKMIGEINPGIVVIDILMNPGFDACYSLNRKFVASVPNTSTDATKTYLPWLKGYWYYPVIGTGISFPIPRKHFLKNIMAAFKLVRGFVKSPDITGLNKYRNAHGLSGWLPMKSVGIRAAHVICPSVREIDFPLVVPDWLGLYGPIVLDTTTIETSDPELYQWLNRGKTVIMCMGTHFHYSESQVKAVIGGFLRAIDHNSNTQFLWKLPDRSKFESLIEEMLKDPRDKERFRIVNWFEADPASIMKHPNIIAYVHHGGANSFFEGALMGLPQIILAQWYDLYDMAARAEYRGIGIYGNRNVAPDIEVVEFGTAVGRLVRPGQESEGFRTRAKAVAEACRKAGGRGAAVDKLLEIIEEGEPQKIH